MKPINEEYPLHFKALEAAELWSKKDHQLQTLGELNENLQKEKEEQAKPVHKEIKKRRERDRKRALYFKIGMSHFWKNEPIPKIIKRVLAQFPALKWVRTSISYHRFRNLRELFQGDLKTKLTENLISLDFQPLPCNCRTEDENGVCMYGGKCRTPIVVYKATCCKTAMSYIGNTQQHPKKRMQGHHQDDNNNGKSIFNPPELLPKCTTVGEMEVCLLYEYSGRRERWGVVRTTGKVVDMVVVVRVLRV
jgi:hypothetical protein